MTARTHGEDTMTPHCGAAAVKPTPADLGIDPQELRWERSGEQAGSIEIAMPSDWVLMRLAEDPSGRILVFDRNEWECFIDGARNGDFGEFGEFGEFSEFGGAPEFSPPRSPPA